MLPCKRGANKVKTWAFDVPKKLGSFHKHQAGHNFIRNKIPLWAEGIAAFIFNDML